MVVSNIPKRNTQFLDIPNLQYATLNYGTDMDNSAYLLPLLPKLVTLEAAVAIS
jgi:hypothetical protein